MLDQATATVTPITANTSTSVASRYEITLTRDRLLSLFKSVSAFVCKDETRFHLNGVLLERTPSGGKCAALRAVATDGHTLARADVPTTDFVAHGAAKDLPDSVLISGESVQELIKSLKCTKRERDMPVTLEMRKVPGKHLPSVSVTIGATRIECRLTDAQFPPYEQVIPKYTGDKRASVVVFNPAYLARACDAIADFGRDTYASRGAKITLGTSDLDPVLVQFDSPDHGDFLAVIMPMRM